MTDDLLASVGGGRLLSASVMGPSQDAGNSPKMGGMFRGTKGYMLDQIFSQIG